jgi:hypothetical protein
MVHGVLVGVGEPVEVAVCVGVGVSVGVAVFVGVDASVLVAERDADGLADERLAVAPVGVRVGLAVRVRLAVALRGGPGGTWSFCPVFSRLDWPMQLASCSSATLTPWT